MPAFFRRMHRQNRDRMQGSLMLLAREIQRRENEITGRRQCHASSSELCEATKNTCFSGRKFIFQII
jgi:hypothetical protein